MNSVADWLSQTSLSRAFQTYEWIVPTIQSLHIVTIGAVLGSVFMLVLRILGWAWRDQTLAQTVARFGPWLSWGLLALLVTGAGMVVGEPARELLAFSFWLKMGLVAIGTVVALVFQHSLRRHAERWETELAGQAGIKVMAVVTLMVWLSVVVLGRLIAYDHVWGSWSKALKG